MSKSNEYNLYQTIKSKLKNVHFTRIESSTQNGIPDVNACKNGSECNRPLSQGAIKIYTGSVVRVSGISDNEPPTLVLGPDKFEWQLLDQLLFPASR
jgi:hypothetical protein